MIVFGFTESGMIRAEIDGEIRWVPDDMENGDRCRIWDEWEMGEPDPITGQRPRINTIPAYVPPPPLPPPPYTLQMSDFWSRFVDDDEYELFDAALSVALPAKDRRAFNAAQFLKSDANLFAWAKIVLVNVVGETRAEVIMAPSEAARGIADG